MPEVEDKEVVAWRRGAQQEKCQFREQRDGIWWKAAEVCEDRINILPSCNTLQCLVPAGLTGI